MKRGVAGATVVILFLVWFIGKVVELVLKHTENQERMIRRLDGIHDELLRLNAAIDRSRKQKES